MTGAYTELLFEFGSSTIFASRIIRGIDCE